MNSEAFIPFVISGVVFGLTSGISPGPLLTLMISETLHHGRKAGIRVAIAPFITDAPIIAVSLFIVIKISSLNIITGVISILGSLFLGYLAYENITAKRPVLEDHETTSYSFRKGVLTNLLNPSPYIFWFTVGAPTVVKAYHNNIESAISFILGFYLCLIGSKVILAVIIDKSRIFLTSTVYMFTVRLLGLLLLLFALLFIKDGLAALGVG